jgi:protein-disulfide isomerase
VSDGGKGIMIGLGVALAGAAAAAVAFSGSGDKPSAPVATNDRAAIEKIVREYILTHPEILPEAMQNLRNREQAKAVADNRKTLETPFAGAWEGAANGDIVLVEFFDYACGYCKASLPDVDRLLAEDKKLKIVYREFPILGPESESAALTSLAVAKSGQYGAFHRALFAADRPDAKAVASAIGATNIDRKIIAEATKSPDIRAEIQRNLGLQSQLNLTGTPSWVVGDRLLMGAVGYDELKRAIAEARAAKAKN